MNYFIEEVAEVKSINDYLAELHTKYPQGIPYLTLIESVSFYINNKSRFSLNTPAFNKWQAFLLFIREIENSIPRSSSYKQDGANDHTRWLERVFRNFLRPFLEETEVKNSNFGIDNNLDFYKATETLHDIFHYGPGKPFADLIDVKTKIKYDVKHNHVDAEKAHDADFLINYQENGICLVCSVEKLKAGANIPDSLREYFDCRSVPDLLAANNLPPDLFSAYQKDLENMLGFVE